jgi:CheY-like chemotaxis protein
MTQTVLYVEDNADNVYLVQTILKRRPHLTLAVARNGRQGIKLAQESVPSLILLDRRLPDMLGEDVLSELKAADATAAIPVVMLSGDDPADHAATLAARGATEFLTKPFPIDRFLAILDRLCAAPEPK